MNPKQLLKHIVIKFKWRKATISRKSFFSNDSTVGEGTVILTDAHCGSITIGDYSYIGKGSSIERTDIGSFCSIGPQVMTGLGCHPLMFVSTYPGFYSNKSSGATWFGVEHPSEEPERIKIASDVWIGARAIILAGVKIGTGAVIGANSVVTKDIPPYGIAVGSPAKVIRFRFNPLLIERLEKSQWWTLPVKELKKLSEYMNNPEKFLDKIDELKK